ncbi:hypothetical protein [Nonomuraea sp. NPDC049400]|uniref:hypothetical protein n=1 Tax=Nonomuraea sp. NPDC049400 TaxID=3364352 RepID=UPI0037AD6662
MMCAGQAHEVALQHWIETTMTFKSVVGRHETINRLGAKLTRTEDLRTANRSASNGRHPLPHRRDARPRRGGLSYDK